MKRLLAAGCVGLGLLRSGLLAANVVDDQHAAIGLVNGRGIVANHEPDAQWFPEAGLGLFLHWGIAAVDGGAPLRGGDMSWAMMPKLKQQRIDDPAERQRIVRERDWDLTGRKPLTPNQYWALAQQFDPQHYDPDRWIAAAKAAGCTYAVLTTRHHDGYALWPSAYGDFGTSTYLHGRDLVRPFVEACRKYGLKVGLYYSPPNWHFDRDSMNFLYYRTVRLDPELPALDADLNPRTTALSSEEQQRHNAAVDAMVKGQVEELLTRYGKIDFIWFDGQPSSGNRQCITRDEIHRLQPGIVIGPRLHGTGDHLTFEGDAVTDDQLKDAAQAHGWAEWCLTWTDGGWSYHKNKPLASDGWILGRLASARSLGVNMLLDLGPTDQGELAPDAYAHLAHVAAWMKTNGAAVHAAHPLPSGETASVPATAFGSLRYLFACPTYALKRSKVGFERDRQPSPNLTLRLSGIGPIQSVVLLTDGKSLPYRYAEGTATIELAAGRRTALPDVVAITLAPAAVPTAVAPIDVRSAVTSAVAPSPLVHGTDRDQAGHRFSFNSRYFLKDGKPWLPVMGEISFSRVPAVDWDDELEKMKAAGIDLVSTYVFWNHHEEVRGKFDWSGDRSLRGFLEACQRQGLRVILRIGPWCHGEVRNGGFPDWLLSGHGQLRTEDPRFMAEVTPWFQQLGLQAKGLLFKDGGPVVGVQIENEFVFTEPPAARYMHALKQLAIESGFDVPVTTEFAWPGGPPGEREFLPMRGGYPDAPWARHTHRILNDGRYRFGPVTFDPFVGADLFGMRRGDSGAPQPFPLALAELGGGLQPTYHRRTVLNANDVVAMAYVAIGSGANLIGYYMFHGGSHPLGRLSTLQESRATGYPNDLAIINYDFQAPIGEYGQTRESYREYRLLHHFLNSYGDRLAPMCPFFPPMPAKNKADVPPLRYAVRALDGSGFLFVNNYRRYFASPAVPGVEFTLQTDAGIFRVPESPVTVPPDSTFIWPFNLALADARLRYATVQPLGRFGPPEDAVEVFSATTGIGPHYQFAGGTVAAIDPTPGVRSLREPDGDVDVTVQAPGTHGVFTVVTQAGRRVRILTLAREQALRATRVDLDGSPHLLLTEADVLAGKGGVRLRQEDRSTFVWWLLPDRPFLSPGGQTRSPDGVFVRHESQQPSQAIECAVQEVIPPAPEMTPDAAAKPQPGPLYGSRYAAVPGSRTWRINVLSSAPSGCQDVRLEIEFTGDTAALYRGETLVADDFNTGQPMWAGLKDIDRRVGRGEFRLQLVPLTSARDIWFDDRDAKTKGLAARLNRVVAHPVYELALR